MVIKLFKLNKRMNSTKLPTTEGLAVDVALKNAVSIYQPVFSLNKRYSGYSYVMWDNRFYFINDETKVSNDIIEITCEIDILATYRGSILDSACYVDYASSSYDDRIVDSRFSTVDRPTYKVNKVDTYEGGGRYIIQYITDKPTFGPSGVAYITEQNAVALSESLCSTEFINFLENKKKQLTNAYEAIQSVRYVPFPIASAFGIPLRLSSFDTGIQVGMPIPRHERTYSIAIPWQFKDFRNQAPYTALLLYLPSYGYIELNPSDFIDKSSLNIKLVIDGITGGASYIINNNIKVDCNLSVSVGFSTIIANQEGVLGGIGKAALNLATGNVAGAIGGVFGAVVASQQRDIGTTGSTGGLSSYYVNTNIECITICHDTNQEPTSVADTLGLPVKKVLPLHDLRGYVQTINASIATDAPSTIKEQLNDMLNRGVYIE